MKNYFLLIMVFVLSACKTTTNIERERTSAHERTGVEADKMMAIAAESKSISEVANIDLELEIERTEYDTSVTDSAGNHPVKATTKAKARRKANIEKDETSEKDSLHEGESNILVHESDTEGSEEHIESDASVAVGVNYGIVAGVALAVMYIFIKLFRR